jgi:hypothetical protein
MKYLLFSLAAFFATSLPAWAKLEIVKVEASYGMLGPERKSLEVYPLDELYFRYQVTGVKVDSDGKPDVEVTMRLVNPFGKTVFEEKPTMRKELSLGGNTFPAFATLKVPTAQKAPVGEYTFSVQVRDKLSSETASWERKLTVKPVSFQIVDQRFWRDAEAKIPASAGGMVGESVHFKLRVIGFDKSKKKVQTRLTVQILDEAGKETLEKPHVIKAEVNDAEEAAKASQVNFNHVLHLNRTGNFTLRLTAQDLVGDQKSVFETPLKVVAP